jgi:hypothetical protein
MMRAAPLLLGVFFAAATVILVCAGSALLWPGGAMEIVWRLYEARRAMLMPYRAWLGPGFLLLAAVMASASYGCLRRKDWGRRLAAAIFAVNGAGDLAQLFLGRVVEGSVGVTVAAALIVYLLRPAAKAAFPA